ncbi:MAG: GGDEF domain-containing protein [Desulfuromonadaceae bacterium]|nr:GGDEF domain-containing protein [Desulfuromonadaceae bacterium]
MHRNMILVLITAVSVLIVLALPLYLKFIAYPAYEEFQVSNAEKEMAILAQRMVKKHVFSAPISQTVPLPEKFVADVEFIQRTVGLPKIKIFSKEGVIVYSTETADIGTRTTKSFFPNMLVDGRPRTELKIIKQSGNLDDVHMIETYVPIMDHGIAVGAFEIYHNITDLRLTFHKMKQDERKILLPVIVLLLAGGLTSSFLAYKSMTELNKAREQFQLLSVTDLLTGLLNRRGFTAQVEKQLAIIQRGGKRAFLLYIDMNDFKSINDNFGHIAGDQALIEAAGILKETLRMSDIIGRIGGDEFAVLTVNNESSSNEDQVKQRLLENLARRNSHKSVNYDLSFSIGVAEYTSGSTENIDELMSRADEKMYAEKQRRKAQRQRAIS